MILLLLLLLLLCAKTDPPSAIHHRRANTFTTATVSVCPPVRPTKDPRDIVLLSSSKPPAAAIVVFNNNNNADNNTVHSFECFIRTSADGRKRLMQCFVGTAHLRRVHEYRRWSPSTYCPMSRTGRFVIFGVGRGVTSVEFAHRGFQCAQNNGS